MKVSVIGAGAIGLCTALALRREGAEVVVLERSSPGAGASSGNAGWITPAFSAPLAAPGVAHRTLRWLLDRDGPVRLRLGRDPSLLRWYWTFWRCSTAEHYRRGMRTLVELNERTFDLFAELQRSGVAFETHPSGLLFVGRTSKGLDEYSVVLEDIATCGYGGAIERLDGDETRRLEPALGQRVIGGIHVPRERHIRPESLISSLVAALRREGGHLHEGVAVTGLHAAGNTWLIDVAGGQLEADRVVVAAGALSSEIMRLVGVRLPLQGAKGYSVTSTGAGTPPRRALYFVEPKIACTAFGEAVRLAGMLDICGSDGSVSRRRVRSLVRASEPYLRDWRPGASAVAGAWAGLRPLTPDGLPMIGAIPGRHGLYIATGHGMLGITLAPATAALLAPIVLGETDGRVLDALAPARFLA